MTAEQTTGSWLTEDYDYDRPRRGQMRKGVVLECRDSGIFVDVGLKRDGFVPIDDVESLEEEAASELEPGKEVVARVMRPSDREGRLVLSLYHARFERDWKEAERLLESGELWRGEVTGYNQGGLIVSFQHLRGFVPASHILSRKDLYPVETREAQLEQYVGKELTLKIIEVDPERQRLVMSERLARRALRTENVDRLMDDLVEGQVCKGTVRHICDFGAFIDLGGADGLAHISELAWRRIRHPGEIVQVGDEVDVYVLRLDRERRRISLSLKRLQPDPWEVIDQTYHTGQVVSGRVTNVVDFGAFVALKVGVEGLIRVSELADPPPFDPCDVVAPGDDIQAQVLSVEARRHRIALSLKSLDGQVGMEPPVKEEPSELGECSTDQPTEEDGGFWTSLLEEVE